MSLTDRVIQDAIGRVDPGRLWRTLERHARVRHHETSPEALAATAATVAEMFRAAGATVRCEAVAFEAAQAWNVIGRWGAVREAPLIIGAHYDTVPGSHGADDNASGLAVLSEIAAVVAALKLVRPVELIAFAFEECGLCGSRAYVARRRKEPLYGMVALECVGYANRRPGSQAEPPGLPLRLLDCGDFLGVVANTSAVALARRFQAAARRVGLAFVTLEVPAAGALLPDTRRSDHAPFWGRGFAGADADRYRRLSQPALPSGIRPPGDARPRIPDPRRARYGRVHVFCGVRLSRGIVAAAGG